MNYLLNVKSFFTFLSRNKTYTIINLFGLSISLMFVILIAVYTVQELSTDHFQTKADRIYILGDETISGSGAAIAYKLKERYPDIEKVCPVVANNFKNTAVTSDDKLMKADLLFADSTFFDFFDFPLVAGERSTALSAMNYAVVSQSFANRMFGTDNPMGKLLLVDDTLSLTISGVMKDIKHSILPDADVIIRWNLAKVFNQGLGTDRLENAGNTIPFILVKPGTDLSAKAGEMATWMKSFFWIYERGVVKEVRMEKLRDYYFSNWEGGGQLNKGDWKFMMVLMSVGILILIFAVFNYINLTVAQAGFRAKEMATRRLMGSSRKELFLRLITESMLVTLLALLIGIFLSVAAVPFVNDLLQRQLDLNVLYTWPWLFTMLAVAGIVGLIAGLIPATIISSSKPIDVVKGTFQMRTKMVFSKVFIIFQHVITISMIAISITMVWQIYHLLHAPLGYNSTNMLAMNSAPAGLEQEKALVNELRTLPCVKRVGLNQSLPLIGSNNHTWEYEGRNIIFLDFVMDKECFEMLGLQFVRDNQVATDGYYFSELAMQKMNLPEDATSVFLDGKHRPIQGILKNFQLYTITKENQPVMFRFLKPNEESWWTLVEVQGDPFKAQKEIGKVFEHVTGLEFEGKFLNDSLQEQFNSQINLAKIIIVFSVIAILISILGLLAMSTYFLQQRMTEVAVRKVFGSGNQQILVRLVNTFLMYVGIAFVIAVPIIWYFIQDWLSEYSYRIEVNPLIFIAAGLFCFLFSFLTVFFQSLRAANTNPTESLKSR